MTPESRDRLTALFTQMSWDPEGMLRRLDAAPGKNPRWAFAADTAHNNDEDELVTTVKMSYDGREMANAAFVHDEGYEPADQRVVFTAHTGVPEHAAGLLTLMETALASAVRLDAEAMAATHARVAEIAQVASLRAVEEPNAHLGRIGDRMRALNARMREDTSEPAAVRTQSDDIRAEFDPACDHDTVLTCPREEVALDIYADVDGKSVFLGGVRADAFANSGHAYAHTIHPALGLASLVTIADASLSDLEAQVEAKKRAEAPAEEARFHEAQIQEGLSEGLGL